MILNIYIYVYIYTYIYIYTMNYEYIYIYNIYRFCLKNFRKQKKIYIYIYHLLAPRMILPSLFFHCEADTLPYEEAPIPDHPKPKATKVGSHLHSPKFGVIPKHAGIFTHTYLNIISICCFINVAPGLLT